MPDYQHVARQAITTTSASSPSEAAGGSPTPPPTSPTSPTATDNNTPPASSGSTTSHNVSISTTNSAGLATVAGASASMSASSSISSITANPATTPTDSTTTQSSTLPSSMPLGNSTISTPSASRTNALPSTSHSTISKSSISSGEAAGIGIGCAAVGALLGMLIMFMIMRRSSRKSARSQASLTGEAAASSRSDEKGFAMTTTRPIVSTSAASDLLPQPVATSILVAEMSTIRTSIRNHVGNFYHNQKLGPESAESVQYALSSPLLDLAHSRLSISSMAANLSDIETRSEAILLLLATTVLSKIDPLSNGTILPGGAAACLRVLDRKQAIQPEGQEKLISRWRQMTFFLLRPYYKKSSFTPGDDRLIAIDATLDALDVVLTPLTKQNRTTDRRTSMAHLLERAAEFGYMITSQPSSWAFDWSGGSEAGGSSIISIVLFPTIVQVADDDGKILDRPIVFGEKAVAVRLRVI